MENSSLNGKPLEITRTAPLLVIISPLTNPIQALP